MAVDISLELQAISNDTYGAEVSNAIAQGLETLASDLYKGADISTNLEIIRTGVYGRNIRQAIYNAIKTLSEARPIGGDSLRPKIDTVYIFGNLCSSAGIGGLIVREE